MEIDANGNIDYLCAGKDGKRPVVVALGQKDEDCPFGGTVMMVGTKKVNICDGRPR